MVAIQKTVGLIILLIQGLSLNSQAQQTVGSLRQTSGSEQCSIQQISNPKAHAVYSEHYYKRLSEFKQESPIKKKEIVMIGNSLTENGGDWSLRLHKKQVRNRGVIGDDAQGIYDRLDEITAAKPKKIFIMVGINDLSHDLSVDSILCQITKVIDKIRQDTPKTKLYIQSILPINESFGRYKKLEGKSDLIPVINLGLELLASSRKAHFINLFSLFTEEDTHLLRKELTNDGLHLNEMGYEIWSKALKKHL